MYTVHTKIWCHSKTGFALSSASLTWLAKSMLLVPCMSGINDTIRRVRNIFQSHCALPFRTLSPKPQLPCPARLPHGAAVQTTLLMTWPAPAGMCLHDTAVSYHCTCACQAGCPCSAPCADLQLTCLQAVCGHPKVCSFQQHRPSPRPPGPHQRRWEFAKSAWHKNKSKHSSGASGLWCWCLFLRPFINHNRESHMLL